MKSINLFVLAALIVTWSCQPQKAKEQTPEEIAEAPEPSLTKVWESDTTIMTPESVIYYEADSTLYVSCIGAVPPDAKDGDGYIAKLSPSDGSIVDPMWVSGLHAPKGLGILDGKLYVTNIDDIWEIDIASGDVLNTYPVEGASFLNDIDISPDGEVFITDSGTDKVHMLKDGILSTVLESSEFNRPNGLLHMGDKMFMSTSGSGNFYEINTNDWTYKVVTDSIFGGDGVELTGVDYLVSSWMGEVYYVSANGDKTLMLDTKETANAADIDYVSATNTVYVPTFFGNQVVAYKLTK